MFFLASGALLRGGALVVSEKRLAAGYLGSLLYGKWEMGNV